MHAVIAAAKWSFALVNFHTEASKRSRFRQLVLVRSIVDDSNEVAADFLGCFHSIAGFLVFSEPGI